MAALPFTPPVGFRFEPTDTELVHYFLKRKNLSLHISSDVIQEIDLYRYNPWDLPPPPAAATERYYFTTRDRRYAKGNRPTRRAGEGYWKATGRIFPIINNNNSDKVVIGSKRALVFYYSQGNVKTDWIMHEYQLLDDDGKPSNNAAADGDMKMDGFVLCKVHKNKRVGADKSQVGQAATTVGDGAVATTTATTMMEENSEPTNGEYYQLPAIESLLGSTSFPENYELMSSSGGSSDDHPMEALFEGIDFDFDVQELGKMEENSELTNGECEQLLESFLSSTSFPENHELMSSGGGSSDDHPMEALFDDIDFDFDVQELGKGCGY